METCGTDNADDLTDLLPYIKPEDQQFITEMLTDDRFIWRPLPGPQTMAYETEADIIGYGGAAGGGKTDLAVGKALTRHSRSMILRREATQLQAIVDRVEQVIGHRDGFNGQKNVWKLGNGKQLEFGSVPHSGDERKYQGRPHDLLVFDEASNFLEGQVRFLLGWLRTVDVKQKCQALLAFNPPTNSEGRWIIEFFAPWLDTKHHNPAAPGELRYFATVDGKEVEVPDGRRFVITPEGYDYNFKANEVADVDIIKPLSRTFIPSRIADNPHLLGTGYMNTLQALPEPLRSQMLHGDFHAGTQDNPYQIIPTKWVEDAMRRWQDKDIKPPMDSLGLDTARGGSDETVLARRHGEWFDKPLAYDGKDTPDGHEVAGLMVSAVRDQAVMHIEINGVGVSPYDILTRSHQHTVGVNVSEASTATDRSGRLKFFNVRTAMWWAMREALDPQSNRGMALPPSKRLLRDLTAPVWMLQGSKIRLESRDDIVDRTGKSPDYGTAYCLGLFNTPKATDIQNMMLQRPVDSASVHKERIKAYNPYDKLD